MTTNILAQSFRASNGLDAAGNKVINVALADRTVGTDGVNVSYVVQENTIQQYDSTRGYLANFSVIFQNRVWSAIADIPSPAGDWDATKWLNIRTDPKWVYNNSSSLTLTSGQFINSDSRSIALTYTLPTSPQDGDQIVIRDVGGAVGNIGTTIVASNQSLALSGSQVRSYLFSIPFSTVTLTFNNRLWQTTVQAPTTHNTTLLSSAQSVSAQSGDILIPSGTGSFGFVLPLIANDRDEINIIDAYGVVPLQHITVTAPAGVYVGSVGKTSYVMKESGPFILSYDLNNKLWIVINEDGKTRGTIITSDSKLAPNQYAIIGGSVSTTPSTINLTLPTKSSIGDFVDISLRKMGAQQTVNIIAATGDTIFDNMGLIEFPKRSAYPQNSVTVTTLTINGSINYPGTYRLCYTEQTNNNVVSGVWVVTLAVPTVEQVDSGTDSSRARLGVIALATQAQANVDKENAPVTNIAITPETLANRVSTETRRGIARIATQAEVSQVTTAPFADDIIVTPLKLSQRRATETMTGIAEIATQSETNAGTDDTTIITPKKLQARQATPTMSGIAALVVAGGNPAPNGSPRGTLGSGIYNSQDYVNIVTPRTIGDLVANESAQGSVYLATQNEVIAGTVAAANAPIVVTPEQLQKKTATESRIGFTQTATQTLTNAGADDFTYVTPLKLQNRIASETLTGIAGIVTQTTFDAGTDNSSIATALKIATHFKGVRTSVTSASGLVQSGNVWSTLALDIKSATEAQRGTAAVASQALTNSGVDDTTIVTPLKLQGKVATEATVGIVQFATAAQTTAGTINNLAVSPVNLLNSFSVDTAWQATSSFRGTVKMSTAAQTWVGDTTNGSTVLPSAYVSDGYAVNPMQLNTALANYLPKTAQAVDSALLGGVAPSSWIRKDITQTITGAMTFSAPVTINNTLSVSGDTNIGGNITGDDISANGYLFASSGFTSDFTPTAQGVYIGWNVPNGQGNAVFFNAQGGGLGGYDFYNTNSSSSTPTNTKLLHITSSGNLNATGLVQGKAFADNNGRFVAQYNNSIFYISNINTDTSIQTTNANTLKVNDYASGIYRIVNEKNMNAILDPIYVNSVGDTMTGRLTISNAATSLNGNPAWSTLTQPTTDSKGYWSIEVTDSTVYNTLPGYAVPVKTTDPISGNQYVTQYSYVNAPGTLSQFGVDTSYSYQIWTPRADVAATGALAQTFWIRQYNPITSEFDDWGRMYTTNNPPTPGEIGATSTTGTTLKNLTVTDWIQVGNVKIYPDTTTKTVKFEWIDS